MARNHLNLFIACVLLVCVCQDAAANLGCLNINLNKLCRKQEKLRSEVEDIWAAIVTSGIQKQDYGNKTRTDDLGINAQEVIAKVDGTLTSIQGLKMEVEHLIVSSRNGLKHEKFWQREAIKNITKYYEDFKTDMTDKNIESKHHLERLDNRAAQLDQTCKNIQNRVENNTIETEKEQNLINERTSHLLENLNATQNRLETENRDLKQMQENNQKKLNSIETENQELRIILVEVRKDNQNMKQTLREVQNDNLKMKTELTKLQPTTTISTTTPLPTTTTTATTTTPLPTTTTTTATTTTPLPTTKPIPILCDGIWKHFNGHCYLVVQQHKSWDDASAYCTAKNSHLLEITTAKERRFVTELVRDYLESWFWIGAIDRDTTGRFIYHHSKLPIPENYWSQGQPDNAGFNEHCVLMYYNTRSTVFELYDYSCSSLDRFVCEKSTA